MERNRFDLKDDPREASLDGVRVWREVGGVEGGEMGLACKMNKP